MMNEKTYYLGLFYDINKRGKDKYMNVCDYCHTEHVPLFDIFNPDYSSVLFRVCHECNIKAFLCPTCLNLRDRVEEYVNGYCIYETKYMTGCLTRYHHWNLQLNN